MEKRKKTIATHSGNFHADDALSIYFLHNTNEFKDAKVVRTRDQSIIDNADCVCDVGLIYDPEKRRFDHHQVGFKETFADGNYPMASCGIVYKEFGKEINRKILEKNGRDIGEHSEYIYNKMYTKFVFEIDCIDNGVQQIPPDATPLYEIRTGISTRISMLNLDGTFEDAVNLIGKEYEEKLIRLFDSEIPAIEIAKEAYESRFTVDASGKIVLFNEPCPAEPHLKNIEKEKNVPKTEQLLYIVSPRLNGNWSIKAIGTDRSFVLRKPLPYKGLRDEELSEQCGIPGGVFVHKNGFLSIFKTKDQAIQFAKLALNSP
ncbi:metal-dependent protein hydrolase [Histomonas meleagridis]|uniref:metal-dependent protein hydrolase n=1 Tax=Histomonas meleagridis TaxID=135588 RepID=UPI00355A33F4|nr:metal-dependent protein hydrolase [Histomonas meleagridis]KAH0796186.1 metal-dependent protein hydrolase [Histomonas meleagridis]